MTQTALTQTGRNLLAVFGGRAEVLKLLRGRTDQQSVALRDRLMSAAHVDEDFDISYRDAGFSTKELIEMLRDEKHAQALAVAMEAAPRMMNELVHDASSKQVPCSMCMGVGMMMTGTEEDPVDVPCPMCNATGTERVPGDGKARELYFEMAQMRKGGAGVIINNTSNSNNDQRQVAFVVGAAGTLPAMSGIVKALDALPMGGPRAMLNAPSVVLTPQPLDGMSNAPTEEAEFVEPVEVRDDNRK